MSIYDEDPITALACLNDATAKYTEAMAATKAAGDAEGEALRALNAHQEDFDRLVRRLRKMAPPDSYWKNEGRTLRVDAR